MNDFQFGANSIAMLQTVRPPLQLVAKHALGLSAVDFAVVQGNRTVDQQMRLYGRGRYADACEAVGVPRGYAMPEVPKVTWTLHSNHIGGNAIDVCPYIHGVPVWDNDGHLGLWEPIAYAFKQASEQAAVPIYWGGDWTSRQDRPHFALVQG